MQFLKKIPLIFDLSIVSIFKIKEKEGLLDDSLLDVSMIRFK